MNVNSTTVAQKHLKLVINYHMLLASLLFHSYSTNDKLMTTETILQNIKCNSNVP